MYVPPHFAETDLPALYDFIERHSFGLLVSQVAGVPFATHIPFLLDRASGQRGTLIGHVARANPRRNFGSFAYGPLAQAWNCSIAASKSPRASSTFT